MRVNTDELQRQASELRTVASRVNDIQDSVLRIARNLSREQFGERFRYPLNSAAASLGKRSEELRRMRTALNQIARLYEQTEMQITDEAEHASVHHQQSGIGSISIPGIAGWIGTGLSGVTVSPWVSGVADTIQTTAVPLAVVQALREFLDRITNRRDREETAGNSDQIIREARENLDRIFREHYRDQWRPVWIDGILQDAVSDIQEGIDVDIDFITDRIGDTIWETIRPDNGGIGIDEEIWEPTPPIPPVGPIDHVIYDDNGNVIARAMNGGISNIADAIGEGVENILEQVPIVGPASNIGGIAADVIQDAFDAVTEAIGDSGFTAGPSPSLDPTGPSLITDPILEAINTGIDIINTVGEAPTLGEAIAGGVGNIDWTPWNP